MTIYTSTTRWYCDLKSPGNMHQSLSQILIAPGKCKNNLEVKEMSIFHGDRRLPCGCYKTMTFRNRFICYRRLPSSKIINWPSRTSMIFRIIKSVFILSFTICKISGLPKQEVLIKPTINIWVPRQQKKRCLWTSWNALRYHIQYWQ